VCLSCRCKRTQEGELGSAHLRRRCQTCRRASMLISRRRRRRVSAGSRHCYKTAGTRTTRCHGGIQMRARKTPGRVLIWGTNCQSNGTLGTAITTHLLVRIPVNSNHQYLPKLFLASSRDQVREDNVVRVLRPRESVSSLRPCWAMCWETTRSRLPRGLPVHDELAGEC